MNKPARLIVVQFNSTNPNVLPPWIRLNSEAPKKPGQDIPSGELIAGPADNISVTETVDEISNLGYELVDAFRRQLPNPKDPKKRYYVVYFLFSPHQFAKPSEEFKKIRSRAFIELRKLSKEAMWATKVFDNPFFADGVEVPDERALVINCMARKPLLENGSPILVWPKGNGKNNPGSGKVPLEPDDYLHIKIGAVQQAAAA